LAIYFLSLPNTTAQQIGLYTSIGWIAGFLLEIPSGYLSDKVGHKTTLVIAKIAMLISTLFFVFGNSLPYFILGSSFIAIGFAFTSGTAQAFLHNTLLGLKREDNYGEIDGKIKAKVSLVSAGMILILPLLTNISLMAPIQTFLIFDLIGIIIAVSLYSPKIEYTAEDIEGEPVLSQLKRFKGTGFYTISIFLGIIGAFITGLSPYKEPFVSSLGFPVILIGSIMAFSRVIWFVVGHNLNIFKKIKIQNLLFYEIFFFSISLIVISQLKNPYIIGIIFAIALGYYFGRESLIQEHYLNNFLINKRYKATMLSIKEQIGKLFGACFTFLIGFIMTVSFSYGFLVSGICMILLLISMYLLLKKEFE
jgi:MFS family permease